MVQCHDFANEYSLSHFTEEEMRLLGRQSLLTSHSRPGPLGMGRECCPPPHPLQGPPSFSPFLPRELSGSKSAVKRKRLEEGNVQLGASESFPSCGLSPTVNTQDGGDAAFPLLGVSASASGREQESRGRGSRGEAMGVRSGQPCPREGLGGCGKFYHSPERLLQQNVPHYRKEILT